MSPRADLEWLDGALDRLAAEPGMAEGLAPVAVALAELRAWRTYGQWVARHAGRDGLHHPDAASGCWTCQAWGLASLIAGGQPPGGWADEVPVRPLSGSASLNPEGVLNRFSLSRGERGAPAEGHGMPGTPEEGPGGATRQ